MPSSQDAVQETIHKILPSTSVHIIRCDVVDPSHPINKSEAYINGLSLMSCSTVISRERMREREREREKEREREREREKEREGEKERGREGGEAERLTNTTQG